MTPAGFLDEQALASHLSAHFGIGLTGFPARDLKDGVASFRPIDIPSPNGFQIRLESGWRSVRAVFQPDNYAAILIRSMGKASPEQRAQFKTVVEAFTASGVRWSLRVNDVQVPEASIIPAAPWERLEISATRLSEMQHVDAAVLAVEAEKVVGASLAAVLSLLPLEHAEESTTPPLYESGLPEGARTRVEVNKYERSPALRAACIAFYGARCQVCGFEFGKRYGAVGQGYIEVHHRTPVSQIGPDYLVNAVRDLVPLCSNCHSMVHRTDPVMDVEELRRQLAGLADERQ